MKMSKATSANEVPCQLVIHMYKCGVEYKIIDQIK